VLFVAARMSSFSQKLSKSIPFLSIILFHLFIVYPQFVVPGQVLLMSDFMFPNLDNRTNLFLSFYGWTRYGLGQPNIPALSMGLIYVLSKNFGIPFAQQSFGFAPLFIASAAMYLFLTRTKWLASRAWAAVIGILYVVSWPVFSYEGDNAALLTVTGLMWTYAVIPLVMLYAHKIFVQENFCYRNVISMACLSWVASLCNSQALVMIGAVLLPFIVFLC
jgi:uncharacterized membrane protein YhdT